MTPRKTRRISRGGSPRLQGGAVNKLTFPPEISTGKAFSDAWNLFYIGSHGKLLMKKTVVPEDTYILFIAPSGEVCGRDDEVLNLIMKRNDTEAEKARFWKLWLDILAGKKREQTLGKIFYNASSTRANRISTEDRRSIAIYEPGDEMYDMKLSFKSTTASAFFETGLYRLPLPSGFLDTVEEINEKATGKTYAEVEKIFADGDTHYRGLKSNMATTALGEKDDMRLSRLIAVDSTLEAGKKRLFIVFACRVTAVGITPEVTELGRAAARRHSISLRKFNAPVEGATTSTSTSTRPAAAAAAPKAFSGFKRGFLKGKK